MRRFWTSTSSTRLSLGFSTGFNSSQEYHLKRPASSKSCCKPYPAKLAPKRHILQEVFQFICIYLPKRAKQDPNIMTVDWDTSLRWDGHVFFGGVSNGIYMGILHRHHQHDFGSSSGLSGVFCLLISITSFRGLVIWKHLRTFTLGSNSKHVYTQVEKVPARLFRCFK